MITSHDFWQSQQLSRYLSAACRVMMALPPPSVIMTTQNISLQLKRETKLLNTIYMNLHTKRKVSLLYLVKVQLIYLYLSNHGWQNHRRVRPDTLFARLLQVVRLNQESILVEIIRPPILAATWIIRDAMPQHSPLVVAAAFVFVCFFLFCFVLFFLLLFLSVFSFP